MLQGIHSYSMDYNNYFWNNFAVYIGTYHNNLWLVHNVVMIHITKSKIFSSVVWTLGSPPFSTLLFIKVF